MRHISNYVLNNTQIANLKTMAAKISSKPVGKVEKTILRWSAELAHCRLIQVRKDEPHERLIINKVCKY